MNLYQFIGSVEMGLIYGLVALGVYLSFRVLQFPDLTVDGSFPLGAAVCASLITVGIHPYLATLAAVFAGFAAGLITAALATRLKVLNLLAGIITMTALYSINLRIMGRPNIALLGESTLFNSSPWIAGIPIYGLLLMGTFIIGAIIFWFLSTRVGLALRATGSNPRMSRAQGINDQKMVELGLGLSNALVALGGALFAQVHEFADISMGVGTIIIGLAAVIIGEAIFPSRKVWQALLACICGAILYRLVIAFALQVGDFGLQATDLNLVTAILVAVAMVLPTFRHKLKRG